MVWKGLLKMLKYEDLSSNKQAFIDWLATPEFARNIKTQRELAKKLGVSEVTLSRWKKDENIIRIVADRKKKLAGVELLPRVIDALADRAIRTDEDGQKYANKDAELFLKWYFGEEFGKGVDVNVSQTNINEQAEISAEERLFDTLSQIADRREDREE